MPAKINALKVGVFIFSRAYLHCFVFYFIIIILFRRLSQKGINFNNLLEEVPVIIKTSNLVNTLISEIQELSQLRGKEEFLSLATG